MLDQGKSVGWRWAITALGIGVSSVLAISLSLSLASAEAKGDDGLSGGQANGEAKNVILFIGDGMGDSEITIARNYEKGAAGQFALDTLPNTGDMTTYSVQEDAPSVPDYVPDSAATATAWATGEKTSSGRLATTASTDEDIASINELAKQAGMQVGNVTTAELTDATPAAISSKINNRDCKGPEDMEDCESDRKASGGAGSIAEQQADGETDVLLGGARGSYEQQIDAGPDAGSTVKQSAERQGYDIVETAAEMEAADPSQRLLGLFAEENLETRWSGEPAQKNLDFREAEPQTCQEDNAPAEQPDLASMTDKAIKSLEARDTQENGFFLQVESASIDKEDHVSNPCEQIGETVNLDNAVARAHAYAEQHPDTLVLVTGDHGHTSQIVPGPDSEYFSEEDSFVPPGESSVLRTKEGAQMMVTYATNTLRDEQGDELDDGEDHTHTGTQIRLAGQGPGSENVVGFSDQTELFTTMTGALGLDPNAMDASAGIVMPKTGGPDPLGWLRDLFSHEQREMASS